MTQARLFIRCISIVLSAWMHSCGREFPVPVFSSHLRWMPIPSHVSPACSTRLHYNHGFGSIRPCTRHRNTARRQDAGPGGRRRNISKPQRPIRTKRSVRSPSRTTFPRRRDPSSPSSRRRSRLSRFAPPARESPEAAASLVTPSGVPSPEPPASSGSRSPESSLASSPSSACRACGTHRAAFSVTASHADHQHVLLETALTVVFGYFCASSFIRASRRSRQS